VRGEREERSERRVGEEGAELRKRWI